MRSSDLVDVVELLKDLQVLFKGHHAAKEIKEGSSGIYNYLDIYFERPAHYVWCCYVSSKRPNSPLSCPF